MRDYCVTKMRRKWKPTRFCHFALLQLLFMAFAEAREMLQGGNGGGDTAALLSFKKKSVQHDPNGFLSNWKSTSGGPCSWKGVSCSSDGRVSSVDLAGGGLVGSLHLPDLTSLPELQSLNLRGNSFSNGDLSSPPSCSLQSLDLSFNNLTGPVARNSFLGSCRRLAAVNLSGNNFSVSISSFDFGDCGGLTLLNLSSGGFSGDKFPSSFENCHLLETLDMSHNDLQGAVPGTLFQNMTKIRRLNLSHNRFSGHIPPEMGAICGTLEDLDLSANNLDGGLPPTLGTCSSLWNLNLGNNQLSGDFLNTVVANLSSLRYLRAPFNNVTGPVPRSLTRLSQLRVLDLSSNSFTGEIPADFCGSVSVLEKLLLPDNYLTGPVPPLLGNCTHLKVIDFSFNSLTGEIPNSIWRLPNISDIVMWANNLTGEIPDGICKAGGNLQNLILNHNRISGPIPNSVAHCTNMVWVSLSSNSLTGEIPPAIGNLLNLAILQLGGNSLSGKIPPELGRCRSLIWLDLNSNDLSGTLPPELSNQSGLIMPGSVAGKQFVFVRNEGGMACRGAGGLVEFEGIRASRLENFPMVHSCPSTRVYSGKTVYTFTENGTMIYLDLSYNSLTGTIPSGYGSMKFLQVLNLGHNRLSGPIPDSFGGLRAIGVLDLSHNSLKGFVPGSLGSLNFLNDLDVSNNNLTGPIPSGGQLTTFPSARYENNSGLCGLPLPACGSKSGPKHPMDRYSTVKKKPFEAALIFGVAFFLTCIITIVFAVYRVKEGQKKGTKYMDNVSTSGSSNWKVSSTHEPLSINVATFETPLKKLTFGHLVEATNRFSSETLIGSGGFGEVYKAKLRDGNTVAIKKLAYVAGQGDREFMAEMETIGKIKHRNLVPLLGYCKVGEERLLVYEYMKWGSLESVLHDGPKHSVNLDWRARKKIAIGAARGLAFLHHSCIPHIIHRDMKSSNVLLDENFEARVSDFGLARLVNALDTHLSVSTLAGTPGYVPPEYYQSFRCTAKGDVYSFGVVLLELLSGKRPIDPNEFGDDNNLVGWAKQLERENRSGEILDSELTEGKLSGESELYRYLRIAFECLDDRPFRRPTMIQVMTMFKELQVDSDTDILDGLSVKDIDMDESREKEP